jgi:amino acid transporter
MNILGARTTASTHNPAPSRSPRKMTVLPMIAATYFMVAGGPYGLEDIVQKTGYRATLLILLLTPLLWSLPTAMMVSELASAIPEEGGFYIWVRRGMGKFWGYQETWLTMAGSVFEMALYPNLFVDYVGRVAPQLTAGHRALWLGFAMIILCTAWNVVGARAVGEGSLWLNVALLAPFVALVAFALMHGRIETAGAMPLKRADLLGGILIAMWNYMGWDNLSTIAGEVESPQKTYTRAMCGAVILVVVSYVVPVAAVARTGIDPNSWVTGGWVDLGRIVGGEALGIAIALAGVIGAFGCFGALMMSFTRLPLVMAEEGYLPKIFTRQLPGGAPWVAILGCAAFWAVCYPLGFESNLILDVLLTGLSIVLEFAALIALRVREPNLPRPYRVPGGVLGTVLISLPPVALMIATGVRNRSEFVAGTNELFIGIGVVLAGAVFYFISRMFGAGRVAEVPAD